MGSTVDIKINTVHRDHIYVYANGDVKQPVTGQVKADFTIEVSIDGVFAAKTINLTEVDPVNKKGWYMPYFTPDVYRIWNVSIESKNYNLKWSQDYRVMDQLVDDISVENLGPGGRLVTITLEDDESGIPIPDAWIVIYNQAESTRLAWAMSDANGQKTFYLDDGNYKVYVRKIGQYVFDNPFNLAVSGRTYATYTGTLFAPSTPVNANTAIVYGWTLTQDEEPIGDINVTADVGGDRLFLRNNPQIVRKASVTTSRASDGYWELALTRSIQYRRADVKYAFTIDGKHIGSVVIPDQDRVGLHELIDGLPCIGH